MMNESFLDLKLPKTLEYRTDNDHTPLEFYISVFPIARQIDMHLGYFSSSAIKVLNVVFAQFIFNGGKLRMIINNILSPEDKTNLFQSPSLHNESYIKEIFSNLSKLRDELKGGSHFFDCLKYMINRGQLEILPVLTKTKGISHYKNILLYDNSENVLYTNGSANFTASGILTNGESFDVSRSWGAEAETFKIEKAKLRFESIFNKKHNEYFYIGSAGIKNAIFEIGKDKNARELLIDSKLILKEVIDSETERVLKETEDRFYLALSQMEKTPRFPFPEPYDYQRKAYSSWVKNSYKGIFAMATGTGKTLTALLCLIEEFKKNKVQRNIFVVPGEELVRQWVKELKDCNFSNVFSWYSDNKNLKKDIENVRILKESEKLNIVITYKSFHSEKFLSVFREIFNKYTVVFDEVHNMGASGFKSGISGLKFNRLIGLSATPLRLWDDDGENEFIEDLFNSKYPDYTFSFPMKEAIGRFLVNYNYYPFFTTLTDAEFAEYCNLTSQIAREKHSDKTSSLSTSSNRAAMRRQLLVDRASNKTPVFLKILQELINKKEHKWTIVYCPKGRPRGLEEERRTIHMLGRETAKEFPGLNIQFFVGETKGRSLLLKDFENGLVDMLFAIKVLDEGVNIPMAQNAVFLASGKNYREFVQRRGRILRKYKSETITKTHANIYDVVIIPSLSQYNEMPAISKKMIISEFKRLFEFYKLATHSKEVFWNIEKELNNFGLSQYYIEKHTKNE